MHHSYDSKTISHQPQTFVQTNIMMMITFFLRLILCWGDLHNPVALADSQSSPSLSDAENDINLGYHYHQEPEHQPSDSPISSSSTSLPFGGADTATLSEEQIIAALQASPAVGPPIDLEGSPKRKKDCGEPSIETKGEPALSSRSCYAATPDELEDDEFQTGSNRKERDAGSVALSCTCETKLDWKDMGIDHYPRFVKTAECTRTPCFNGLSTCMPIQYSVLVLKKIVHEDHTSHHEDEDNRLPDELRADWKFITVSVITGCECKEDRGSTGV